MPRRGTAGRSAGRQGRADQGRSSSRSAARYHGGRQPIMSLIACGGRARTGPPLPTRVFATFVNRILLRTAMDLEYLSERGMGSRRCSNEVRNPHDAHGCDDAGCCCRNASERPVANHHHHRQRFATALLPVSLLVSASSLRRSRCICRPKVLWLCQFRLLSTGLQRLLSTLRILGLSPILGMVIPLL